MSSNEYAAGEETAPETKELAFKGFNNKKGKSLGIKGIKGCETESRKQIKQRDENTGQNIMKDRINFLGEESLSINPNEPSSPSRKVSREKLFSSNNE